MGERTKRDEQKRLRERERDQEPLYMAQHNYLQCGPLRLPPHHSLSKTEGEKNQYVVKTSTKQFWIM